jgi:opacity protein-like surface antigen
VRAPSLKSGLGIAAIGVLLLLPSPAPGIELQMRLSSGLWRMKLDEVNTAIAGWEDGVRRAVEANPNAEFISGESGRLRLGVDFEAELILSFSRWIKVGLSAGYGHCSVDEEATLQTIDQGAFLNERARPTKVSAYPFLASGYFCLPLGQKFSLYLRAGVGAIQATYISREALKKSTESRFTYTAYDNAKVLRPTYLGGLGLSYTFDESLDFFVEAVARFARVSGLTGEDFEAKKGTLYAYEQYAVRQPVMKVLPEPPSASYFHNVREATVDLSGFSVKMGLTIKF